MTPRSKCPRHPVALLVALCLLLAPAATAQAAQPAVGLGAADRFAVLGGSTVTNTGPSVINGDLGLSPGTSITGFPPGTINGTVHATDAVAAQAQTDLTAAYTDAAGRTPAVALPADIGGLFLSPGVYGRPSSLLLTGDVTLDAQGNPNAVFIFQVGSTITTASNSRVLLVNGAQACNVFWQIGSSATLGTDTAFQGNILALASITMNTRATLRGRDLARNGAVTLDTNTITRGDCAPGTTPGGGPAPGGGGTVPGGGPAPGGGGTVPGGGPAPGGRPAPGGPRGLGGGSLLGLNGAALVTTTPRAVARTVTRYGTARCVEGTFRALVSGLFIRRVTFLLDGRKVGTLSGRPPFVVVVHSSGGIHRLSARVSFTDGTPTRNISFRYRACGAATRRVAPQPRFTG